MILSYNLIVSNKIEKITAYPSRAERVGILLQVN